MNTKMKLSDYHQCLDHWKPLEYALTKACSSDGNHSANECTNAFEGIIPLCDLNELRALRNARNKLTHTHGVTHFHNLEGWTTSRFASSCSNLLRKIRNLSTADRKRAHSNLINGTPDYALRYYELRELLKRMAEKETDFDSIQELTKHNRISQALAKRLHAVRKVFASRRSIEIDTESFVAEILQLLNELSDEGSLRRHVNAERDHRISDRWPGAGSQAKQAEVAWNHLEGWVTKRGGDPKDFKNSIPKVASGNKTLADNLRRIAQLKYSLRNEAYDKAKLQEFLKLVGQIKPFGKTEHQAPKQKQPAAKTTRHGRLEPKKHRQRKKSHHRQKPRTNSSTQTGSSSAAKTQPTEAAKPKGKLKRLVTWLLE